MAEAARRAAGEFPHRLSDPFAGRGDRRSAMGTGRAAARRRAGDARRRGIAVGVSTADCGPILFADATARVIGAAHAGWRGAFTGVIEATIAAMEKIGADRDNIVAAAGPMIRQAELRSGSGIRRALQGRQRGERALLHAEREGRPRDVRSRGLHQGATCRRPASVRSRTSAAAPMPTPKLFTATGARCTATSPITDDISTRSHWRTESPGPRHRLALRILSGRTSSP